MASPFYCPKHKPAKSLLVSVDSLNTEAFLTRNKKPAFAMSGSIRFTVVAPTVFGKSVAHPQRINKPSQLRTLPETAVGFRLGEVGCLLEAVQPTKREILG